MYKKWNMFAPPPTYGRLFGSLLLTVYVCGSSCYVTYIADSLCLQQPLLRINPAPSRFGEESAGVIRSSKTQSYRHNISCDIRIQAPSNHGVILYVKQIDFRPLTKDVLLVFESRHEAKRNGNKVWLPTSGLYYVSKGNLRLLYQTQAGDVESGTPASSGFIVTFTVYRDVSDVGTCDVNEFQCSRTRCIWAGFTCDGQNNCGDGTDESEGSGCNRGNKIALILVISFNVLLGVALLTTVISWCLLHWRKHSDSDAPVCDNPPSYNDAITNRRDEREEEIETQPPPYSEALHIELAALYSRLRRATYPLAVQQKSKKIGMDNPGFEQ